MSMRNGERELRIPRSPMETDEGEFAAECERPATPKLWRAVPAGADDEDFGRNLTI